MKFSILVTFTFLFVSLAHSDPDLITLSWSARLALCETLLQSKRRLAELPLNSEVVATLLENLNVARLIKTGSGGLALHNPELQGYLAVVSASLKMRRDPDSREIVGTIENFRSKPGSPEVSLFEPHPLPRQVQTEFINAAEKHLAKVPKWIRERVNRAGRRIVLLERSVLEHPHLVEWRGVWLSNGVLADTMAGAAIRTWKGGAYVASSSLFTTEDRSTLLHEFFHLVDYSAQDLVNGGSYFSATLLFQKAWSLTRWIGEDSYLKENSREAFAECAALYYFSSRTRQWMYDQYPLMYAYFQNFEDRSPRPSN